MLNENVNKGEGVAREGPPHCAASLPSLRSPRLQLGLYKGGHEHCEEDRKIKTDHDQNSQQ